MNDLRANKWKQRKVVDQGPKKITEIHQEIQQEHAQLMQDREAVKEISLLAIVIAV